MGEPGLQERAREIESLVAELEATPDPALRMRAQELVQAVLDLHAAGFARALELLGAQGEPGRAVADALAQDPLTGGLLALHGLHPLPLEERVRGALEETRAQLALQGCTAELLSASAASVRVRLTRTAFGYAASPAVLRALVEEAIAARAPDADAVELEGELTPAKGEAAPLVQLHVPAQRSGAA